MRKSLATIIFVSSSMLLGSLSAGAQSDGPVIGVIADGGAGKTDGPGCFLSLSRKEAPDRSPNDRLVFCEGWMNLDGEDVQLNHVSTMIDGKQKSGSIFLIRSGKVDLGAEHVEKWKADQYEVTLKYPYGNGLWQITVKKGSKTKTVSATDECYDGD